MIRPGRATVELLPSRRPRPELRPLLHALARVADLHASDRSLTDPRARIATSTDAVGLERALRDDVPIAVALASGEETPPEVAERADVLLVPRLPGQDDGAPSSRTVTWPVPSIDAAAHPPLTPFVRERWREHLGLPPVLVVVAGFDGATPLPDAAVPSALALCSSAAVRGPQAVLGLALGAPLVTDALEAARLGARDEVEVVIAAPRDAATAAEELAHDVRRAARLGWAARLLAEQRHDVRPAADAVAARLGLPRPMRAGDSLEARLDELGTPPGAAPAARAFERCEPFLALAEVREFAS
jgi:hypothetical protein